MGNAIAIFTDLPYSNNHIYDLWTRIVDDIRRTIQRTETTQVSFGGHRYRIQYKHNADIAVLGTANDSNLIPLLQCFQTKIIKLSNDN
jgi:hypothetical protein